MRSRFRAVTKLPYEAVLRRFLKKQMQTPCVIKIIYKDNVSNGDPHPWQVERAKKKLQERRDEETPNSHFLKHKMAQNTTGLSRTRWMLMQMAYDS